MYLYPIHPDDLGAFEGIRQQLILRRRLLDVSAKELSLRSGRGEGFLYGLENQLRDSPLLSSLQDWAKVLGCRVEFGIENFWLHSHTDREMLTQYTMSRQWGEDVWMRQWLVSALRVWRIKQGMDVEHVAPLMGVSAAGIRDWESQATDPVLKRLMLQARVLGSRLTLQLWQQEDWNFQ